MTGEKPSSQPPAFLRLFIALAVPPKVRQEIKRTQNQLQRCSTPGRLSWTQPEQFHVTLKFLGDVPATDLDLLKEAVTAACVKCSAMELTAGGIGFFPNPLKPHVVWAGANDAGDRLTELHRRIDEAVRPFAPAEPHARFTGHITLGRFKPGRKGSLDRLLEKAAQLGKRNFGTWPAKEVELVRSELTSEGARHQLVQSFQLE